MRATKAELLALGEAIKLLESDGLPLAKPLRSLHTKLSAKPQKRGPDVPVADIEAALVSGSGGKVVKVVGAPSSFWARMTTAWGSVNPSLADVAEVANYLAGQAWLTPMTMDSVVHKWPAWLGKARAHKTTQRGDEPRTEFIG